MNKRTNLGLLAAMAFALGGGLPTVGRAPLQRREQDPHAKEELKAKAEAKRQRKLSRNRGELK